jgi:hypothetical protein
MVTMAVRDGPAFCWTVNVATPLPDRDGIATSIQLALAAAVQTHAATLAVTVGASVPPVAGTLASEKPTVNRHGAASCATPTCVSFTPTVACRAAGSVLAATLYVTLPLPCPCTGELMAIHDASLDTVHVQSRLVSMAMVPDAPVAGTDGNELVATTEHFAAVGALVVMDDDPHA